MAFKKNFRRRRPMSKKRNFRNKRRSMMKRFQRRRSSFRAGPVTKVMPSIPDKMFVKLRYTDLTYWGVLGQGPAVNTMSYFSSLNQPKSSDGGINRHQPYWYDQYTPGIFTKFRVHGVKYRVTVTNRDVNTGWWLAIRPQNTMVPEQNMQTLMERKNTKFRQGAGSGSGRAELSIKGYMSVAKTLGIDRSEIANDEYYAADYSVNPIRMAYLYVYMSHNGDGTHFFDAKVDLTFYAELFNRAVPQGS